MTFGSGAAPDLRREWERAQTHDEEATVERLTPLADAFLEAEDADPGASLAIGSFSTFAGPAPDFEAFVATIAGRLPLIPRYRQKLRRVPFGLAAPAWVDAPDFDIHDHLRRTALPAPGGDAEVAELMNQHLSTRMDRSRPLWEYCFVEGLAGGRWGLVSKVHHCMVDGVSGTDLYQLLLDPGPTPQPGVPDTWVPQPPLSTARFTAGAVRELVTSPVRAAGALARAARAPRRLASTALGLAALSGSLRPVHPSSLSGELRGGRRYAWTTVSLDEIRTVRTAFGVTVNDVALTMVTGALRALLLSRGETPDGHALRSLVPVSTRLPGEESIPDNRVTLMLPYLPVDVADPVERLTTVSSRIRSLRGAHEPEGGVGLTSAAEYVAFPAMSWGTRLGFRLPQHQISVVTTNVPGPREPLYALGRQMHEILPYVPIADRVRISIAMLSYHGDLTFGVTSDLESTPDIDVLITGIRTALAELVLAAQAAG